MSGSDEVSPVAFWSRRRRALGLFLLVVAVFAITLGNDFVYDDRFIIVENPAVHDPAAWGRFFTDDSWAGVGVRAYNYRPLPLLSFGLNHLVGGLRPVGYHAVDVTLHALCALILLALAGRLGLSPAGAWLAAALFAVHPLQAEPVAEIVGRMDIMAGMAFLGALACHLAGRRRQLADGSGGWLLAAAVLLYAAGLLSKEHVILLPLVAVVADLLLVRPHGRVGRRVYAGYALAAAVYLAARWVIFEGEMLSGEESLVDNPLATVSGPLRVVSALRVAGMYLGHVVWPRGLSPDYCYAQILPFDSLLSAGALATMVGAALGIVAVVWLAHRSATAAVAIALAIGPFLPVSNVPFPILTVMGDRLFYLPLAGIGLLAGLVLDRALDRAPAGARRAAVIGAGAVVVVLSLVTVRQLTHWRSNYTVDRLAVRNAPECTRARSNFGHDLLDRGDLDGAERQFRRSLEIYPELDAAIGGLARTALRRGDHAEALRQARRALELRADSTEMLELAGAAARQLGDAEAARRFWERRLEIDPGHAVTLSDLAVLLWNEGETGRAVELWRRAVALPDTAPEVWFNLARALERVGDRDGAAALYRRFLEREAGDTEARAAARGQLLRLRGEG